MNCIDLGFDDWFEQHLVDNPPNHHPARIITVDRDRYLVCDENGERHAELAGKLLFQADTSLDMPTVGDWVTVEDFDNCTFSIIHSILPRRTVLKRKTAGKSVAFQLLASNIDTAFIMQSVDHNFNLRRLERYLVVIRDGGITPTVLLSKTDLEKDKLSKKIAAVSEIDPDLPIYPFSNLTGKGLKKIQAMIEVGKTYSLLGSSGVGKTTLLNRLIGEETFAVQEVREEDGKGRHTTTRRHLIVLPSGGMIIDTPGMRELGTIDMSDGIVQTFPDFEKVVDRCRYKDCTHVHETGCAVLEAVENGDLDASRYESYLKLRRESAHHARSYLEKRQRDKAFGKMVKTMKKIKNHR